MPRAFHDADGRCRSRRARSRSASRRQQIGFDELLKVTVHHSLDVADLDPGAVILDALLRMEGVGTDLATECDALLLARELRQLFFLLVRGQLEQPRLENPHGGVAITQLRALVLA